MIAALSHLVDEDGNAILSEMPAANFNTKKSEEMLRKEIEIMKCYQEYCKYVFLTFLFSKFIFNIN